MPENDREPYRYGRCMFLAAALNRWLGWPLEGEIAHEPSGPYIDHAWVRTPLGQAFDVDGEAPLDAIRSEFSFLEYKAFADEAELRQFVRADDREWEAGVAEALAFAQRHWSLPSVTPSPAPQARRAGRSP